MPDQYDSGSMIKYLIGASRIKYSVLDDILRPVTAQSGKILFLVDAHSIIYRLYRMKDLDTILSIPEEVAVKDLVINFLNVIGHYRRYFATHMGCDNDIIIFFNRKLPSYHEMYYPDYQKKLYERYDAKHKDYAAINHIVTQAMKFVESLVPYFEYIYFFNNLGIDDYAAMFRIADTERYNCFYRIIFSRNMYATQLIDTQTSQLYNSRDKSYLIIDSSVFSQGILKDRKTKASESLTAKMLPLIWTLSGCSDFDMGKSKYFHNVTSVIKMLNPLVEKNVVNDEMSIQSFLQAISSYVPDYKAELRSKPTELINRYRVANCRLASSAITQDQDAKLISCFIDLYDQPTLESINERLSDISDNSDFLEIDNLNLSEGYHWE